MIIYVLNHENSFIEQNFIHEMMDGIFIFFTPPPFLVLNGSSIARFTSATKLEISNAEKTRLSVFVG